MSERSKNKNKKVNSKKKQKEEEEKHNKPALVPSSRAAMHLSNTDCLIIDRGRVHVTGSLSLVLAE
jgi:hypothetical protein